MISVAPDGTMLGVNSSGALYAWFTDDWERLPDLGVGVATAGKDDCFMWTRAGDLFKLVKAPTGISRSWVQCKNPPVKFFDCAFDGTCTSIDKAGSMWIHHPTLRIAPASHATIARLPVAGSLNTESVLSQKPQVEERKNAQHYTQML